MLTQKKIETSHNKVKTGDDFPNFIKDIVAMGVKNYEVVLTDGTWSFTDAEGQVIQFNRGMADVHVSSKASPEKFKKIVSNHQQGEIDYATFCLQAGECGVERWLSDFEEMTVTYFSLDGTIIDVEPLPRITNV